MLRVADMPKHPHEVVVDIIQKSPRRVVGSLRALGMPIPALRRVRKADSNLTRVLPVSRRADCVLLLADERNRSRFCLLIEVQMRRNWRKPRRWLSYLAAAGDEHACPVLLLVLTPDSSVARWASRKRPIDPLHAWAPVVIGPARLPPTTDVGALSKHPFLALLLGLANGRDPERVPVLEAIFRGLSRSHLPPLEVGYYWEVILTMAAPAIREQLRWTMEIEDFKPQTEFGRRFFGKIARSKEEGRTEGRVEGRTEFAAQAVLDVLQKRGWKISAADRARVLACKRPAQLRVWLRRAVTAESVRLVFEPTRRTRRG